MAGTMGPSRADLRHKAQPDGALPLPEPAGHLAGDPMVAAPLQVPPDRFAAGRPAGVGDDAASRYCRTRSTVCQAGTLTLDGSVG